MSEETDTPTDEIDPNILSFGSYQSKPLIIFDGNARFPFSFGQGKARLLLRAIDAIGAERFIQILREFATK